MFSWWPGNILPPERTSWEIKKATDINDFGALLVEDQPSEADDKVRVEAARTVARLLYYDHFSVESKRRVFFTIAVSVLSYTCEGSTLNVKQYSMSTL